MTGTRTALHAVAEQVLARARWESVGRIGLEVTPGGFGTPAFPAGTVTARVVRLEGLALVVDDDGVARRTELTTLAAAAAFVGTPLGAPPGVYPPATSDVAADAPLLPDPAAAREIAAWFGDGAAALDALRGTWDPAEDATAATLWPEHFDLGLAAGAEGHRSNFGVSPGDAGIAEPYAYVGPWTPPARVASYWNAVTFRGAYLPARVLPAAGPDRVAAVLAFFEEGRRLLTG